MSGITTRAAPYTRGIQHDQSLLRMGLGSRYNFGFFFWMTLHRVFVEMKYPVVKLHWDNEDHWNLKSETTRAARLWGWQVLLQ